MAGGALGSFCMAVAVAVGMGAIIQTSAVVFNVIKTAGVLYLIYLGVQAIRHRRRLREAFEARLSPVSARRAWWEGFVVGATNSKTAVFFAATLPRFVDASSGHVALQMLLLSAIFGVLALGSDTVWSVLASAARTWFGRSARRMELMGGAAGLTMIGLGLSMAFTARKD